MDDSAPSLPSIWASMNSWFTPTVLFVFLNLMIGTILFTSNIPNYNHHHNNNNKQEDHNEKTQNHNELIQSKLVRSPSILHRLRSFNLYPHRSQQDASPAIHHQQHEALEIAATQYVFNHPFSHEHDVQTVSANPDGLDLNPTRFDHESESQYAAFNHTNEVLLPNVQTHFVFEQKHTVEKVTAHFDVGPENPEDSGFEETHEQENDEFQSLDEVYSIITGGHVNRTKSDTLPASGEIPVKLPVKMKKSASLKSAFSHFEEEKIVEARRPATVRERRSASRATEEDDVEVDAKADDFINKFKHQLKLQRLDSIIRYKDMVHRGSGK
ncbi:uncharacterized protein LOC112522050 [Cynara cardunculus var. scolymus]|uniref:DUF4408 domain-containing protein n=1 Tax=Cynara cardunculus var. scolymus TaxID=59895 RepID=A0A118JT89_CYNCS|nr:uncharacterized protein LOC112522050 [Cynara cardunculus var. scolymus]KVH89906.1 protein of unknown function DUF4408 [Cynara cardunculus var. scolymus]